MTQNRKTPNESVKTMINNTEISETLEQAATQSAAKAPENTDIKVSVIMPIYNAYDYLRPAMDSVTCQSLREIEIICIDDGSTDHSLDIIREYQKIDDRIRIVTETNAGPALARNNGLRRARGEYVAFLDADDFYESDLLEKLYSIAKSSDLDIAIAKYDIYNTKKSSFRENVESEYAKIYDGGAVTSKNEHPDHILQSTPGYAWDKLFKRSFLLEKNIVFLEEVKMFEDVFFTVCAVAFAERIGKVDEVLIHHRIHSEQARARLFKKYFAQVPEVYVKIKEFLMKGGMYEPLYRAFLNLSVGRCSHIYSLLWSDAREDFWNLLHTDYVDLLGWSTATEDVFSSSELCEFCASVVMYDHKQKEKRTERGAKLKLVKIARKIKRSKRLQKIRAFFVKIFGKNKKSEDA